MVKDSIANLIVSLKNASSAGHDSVVAPFSKINLAILELLQKQGYVGEVSKKGKKVTKSIEVALLNEAGKPKIQGVKRISTFSKRMYQGAAEIRPVKNGFGLLILSTPKGILTDKEAKKEKVGGELLFKIW
jgi:small subunit ribosomal protein S8